MIEYLMSLRMKREFLLDINELKLVDDEFLIDDNLSKFMILI